MTEYDYSPEGYQRYLDTQRRISRWVENTNAYASQFRSPFGYRTEPSSSSRSRPNPHGERVREKESTRTRSRTEDRGRRNSMSATTLRPSASGGSNVAAHTAQRSSAYTPQSRHSYPYAPASRESHVTDRTTQAVSMHSNRRAQSVAPRPSQTHSTSHSHAHRHTSSQLIVNSSDPPKRSSTLPAYIVATPNQSAPHNYYTQSSHRPSSSHRSQHDHHHSRHQHHHHHHQSRSKSTPRSSSLPLAVAPVYDVGSGSYVVVPPRGRKVTVMYA
ncbi:hypothetical protein EV361DRAFT_146327 [Lentinula raphanica]|uniref:Uncharacterized protein n=1 Tax=Lentinula raphanica TaxID=153919 RepID=A0AA38P953_9AGAR|nr:hypothetical protein F5878DRAFT_161096 [Lentinula raphanica]KAJ3977032.1 hypothetical protein EV361DRAFT_146327 [Lentinula raphanica]